MQIWLVTSPDAKRSDSIVEYITQTIRDIALSTHVKELFLSNDFVKNERFEDVKHQKNIQPDDIFFFFYPCDKSQEADFQQRVFWFPQSTKKAVFLFSEDFPEWIQKTGDMFVTLGQQTAERLVSNGVYQDRIYKMEFPDIITPLPFSESDYLKEIVRMTHTVTEDGERTEVNNKPVKIDLFPTPEMFSVLCQGRTGFISSDMSGYEEAFFFSLYIATGIPVMVDSASVFAGVTERLNVGWVLQHNENPERLAEKISPADYRLTSENVRFVSQGMNSGVNTRRMLFSLLEIIR